ncbi:MAG: TetR/AcrR family transcriptional regulator [Lachnospiraceae bacterium]|nr:TetR/AcrR family transcriptional regulator [Lachnospiraceae bacterium]
MNEKFFDLAKEKQDRIMNAAISTFARRGYKCASTDEMKARAGISKGLLFHYFGDKSSLYGYVCDYSARYVMLEMKQFMGDKDLSYFEMLLSREEAFSDVIRNYPSMPTFLDSLREEDDSEALELAEGSVDEYRKFMLDMRMRALDTVKMDAEDRMILDNTMEFTLSRIRREAYMREENDFVRVRDEAVSYVKFMKKLVTKRSVTEFI